LACERLKSRGRAQVRIAAFMAALEGAVSPVVRALCARLELQPFHRLAETLTRLLHT
jgi:hypothetical protein